MAAANREIVRAGYNQIAAAYLDCRYRHAPDVALLASLIEKLPPNAAVLDAGCGAGVPVTQTLARHFQVTGIDFSISQLRLARKLVPEARFACQDLTRLGLAAASFHAVCSYYAIIHVPRRYHAQLLAGFYRLLAPGGLALLCLGAEDLPADIEEDYFGSTMYWSHYDAATNKRLLRAAGFELLWSELVPDTAFADDDGVTGRHLFVLAQKGATSDEFGHSGEKA